MTRYFRTLLTTPANCADSLSGSAKLELNTEASSSVAMYDESTAWPTRSMAVANVPVSDSENALYLAPSSE